MGIVHGEAGYLPDFLEYFSTGFSSAPVKMEILGKKDIETTTMANFYSQVSGRDRSVGENGWRSERARLILSCCCLLLLSTATVQLCYVIQGKGVLRAVNLFPVQIKMKNWRNRK